MKKNRQPPIKRRIAAGVFLLIGLALAGLLLYSFLLSRIVRLDRTTLVINDLPPAFEGKTILYVSDIDMVGLSGSGSAAGFFDDMAVLKPDILILGGDYANYSLWDRINSTFDDSKLARKRRDFFAELADFPAPLGKFAVAGENEAGYEALSEAMTLGGVKLIENTSVKIQLGGDVISVAGFPDHSQGIFNYEKAASVYSSKDCVIAVAHNPASISAMITAEAKDSGRWCDVILTGHTHAGQIVMFGRTALKLTESERRYADGWSKESGVFTLVSSGLGCEGVNLRFGTCARAYLITLRGN